MILSGILKDATHEKLLWKKVRKFKPPNLIYVTKMAAGRIYLKTAFLKMGPIKFFTMYKARNGNYEYCKVYISIIWLPQVQIPPPSPYYYKPYLWGDSSEISLCIRLD